MNLQRFLCGLLLLTLLTATLVAWVVVPTTAAIRLVPQDYPTIQDAVDAARAGDTIQVAAGTYFENVLVTTRVTIVGEDATTTVVDGGGNDVVFNIQADNVELRELTIRNGGSFSGVNVFYPYSGLVIRNTRIVDNVVGVVLSEVPDNTIEDNIFLNNSMYGIDVTFSSGNVIRNNQISEGAYGIEISDTSSSQVVNNTVSDTSYGVYAPFSNGINISANTLISNSWNIYLAYSNSNIIGNNTASGSSIGIQAMSSQGNSIFNNTVSNSSYGIYLGYCDTSTISGNTVSLNDWGIELFNSSGSTIKENFLMDNTWGFYIAENSKGNDIYHNNVVDNVKQVFQDFTSGQNTWRTPITPYQGNYWSDYKGVDTDSDGIGDSYLPWAGVDWYPLMAPWGVYDVAVTNVTVSATQVNIGESVNITVTVKNEGMTATFTVSVYANVTLIGQQNVSSLTPGVTETLLFTWNTTTFSSGIYVIKAEASIHPEETDTADNVFVDGTITISGDGHDVAVNSVLSSQTVAHKGYTTVEIYVNIENQGDFEETFNVTAYYNSSELGTQTVTLSSGANVTRTFTWNVTTASYGFYVISAEASAVPGETDVADNQLVNGIVTVTIPGDVNGDRSVNILDAGFVSAHWFPGPPVGPLGYDANVDINSDGEINIGDTAIVNANWQESW